MVDPLLTVYLPRQSTDRVQETMDSGRHRIPPGGCKAAHIHTWVSQVGICPRTFSILSKILFDIQIP